MSRPERYTKMMVENYDPLDIADLWGLTIEEFNILKYFRDKGQNESDALKIVIYALRYHEKIVRERKGISLTDARKEKPFDLKEYICEVFDINQNENIVKDAIKTVNEFNETVKGKEFKVNECCNLIGEFDFSVFADKKDFEITQDYTEWTCNNTGKRLRQLFPSNEIIEVEQKEEQETKPEEEIKLEDLIKNEWYKFERKSLEPDIGRFITKHKMKDAKYPIDISLLDSYLDGCNIPKKIPITTILKITKPTKEELINHIEKVVEERGYKEGVEIECLTTGKKKKVNSIKINTHQLEENKDIWISSKSGWILIYRNGEWADIIK